MLKKFQCAKNIALFKMVLFCSLMAVVVGCTIPVEHLHCLLRLDLVILFVDRYIAVRIITV